MWILRVFDFCECIFYGYYVCSVHRVYIGYNFIYIFLFFGRAGWIAFEEFRVELLWLCMSRDWCRRCWCLLLLFSVIFSCLGISFCFQIYFIRIDMISLQGTEHFSEHVNKSERSQRYRSTAMNSIENTDQLIWMLCFCLNDAIESLIDQTSDFGLFGRFGQVLRNELTFLMTIYS